MTALGFFPPGSAPPFGMKHSETAAMDKHFNTILLFWLNITTIEQGETSESNKTAFYLALLPEEAALK